MLSKERGLRGWFAPDLLSSPQPSTTWREPRGEMVQSSSLNCQAKTSMGTLLGSGRYYGKRKRGRPIRIYFSEAPARQKVGTKVLLRESDD